MSVLGFGVGVGMKLKVATASPAGPSFPSTGLVAAWSFDDTLTDSVGSKVLTPSGGNSYVAGKLGTKALQLTAGNSASITDALFNLTSGACSFACWYKRVGSSAGANPIFGAFNGWGVVDDYLSDSYIYGDLDIAGSNPSLSTTTAAADDTWTLVVVTSDGSAAAKLYVNKTLAGTASGAGAIEATPSGYFAVGSAGNSGSTSNNTVFDALYVWNVELTSQNVTDLYNSGSGLTP